MDPPRNSGYYEIFSQHSTIEFCSKIYKSKSKLPVDTLISSFKIIYIVKMGSIEQFTKQFPSQLQSDCSNVYGSQFAARQMPTQKLPDNEMPRDLAYQLIKDELVLDGLPMLKSVYISTIKNKTNISRQSRQLCHYLHGEIVFPF
jgi:hypothetical protein